MTGACPAFSIVVPTHQRREVVCDAVRAIGQIAYDGPLELIVVVDGSTDGTAAALRELDLPFPLAIIEQPNRGAASARNRGAAAASGEIILFLDDDMICDPAVVSHHAASHAAGAEAVVGDIPLDPMSPPGFLADAVGAWAARRRAHLAAGAQLGLHDLLTGQLSVRRQIFEALGGFDEGFTRGGSFGNEDLDLGVRLLAEHDVRYNPQARSWQRYVVTPRQHLRQWRDAGEADVRFAFKHPSRAAELRQARKGGVVRRLAALPGVARAVMAAAVALAEGPAGRHPLLGRVVARLF